MPPDEQNQEAHQLFDERIRDVELSQASIVSTVQSINTNLTDMKNMFQKFTADSEKIASKTDAIYRVEKDNQSLAAKYDELYKKFILIEHQCNNCQIGDVNKVITDVSKKVDNIERAVEDIKGKDNKFSGFWNDISKTIVTIIILYILYVVANAIQTNGNIIANPPDIKKKSEKENSLILSAAEAAQLGNYSSHLEKHNITLKGK